MRLPVSVKVEIIDRLRSKLDSVWTLVQFLHVRSHADRFFLTVTVRILKAI